MDKPAARNQRSPKRANRPAADPAQRPSRAEAEEAVRTLIQWAGDDPDREGLVGTPARVVRAYEEWFAGYFVDPREYLQRTFEEVAGYDEIVLLRNVRFESHCEAPYRANHRSRSYRLSSAQSGGRHFQSRPPDRRLCEAASSSGEDDSGDRQMSERSAQAVRGRRGGGGGPR